VRSGCEGSLAEATDVLAEVVRFKSQGLAAKSAADFAFQKDIEKALASHNACLEELGLPLLL
jgi:hypothetical protein